MWGRGKIFGMVCAASAGAVFFFFNVGDGDKKIRLHRPHHCLAVSPLYQSIFYPKYETKPPGFFFSFNMMHLITLKNNFYT